MLARGELQTIGATTLDEYRKHLEKDAALERRFQPIQVARAVAAAHHRDPQGPARPLRGAPPRLHHRRRAGRRRPTLADRYISDRFLPDKAIDLIDEAGSRMRIRRMTAPPDLREFDEKIADVRREKESAIDAQDFEKAASLRDKEKQLLAGEGQAGEGVEGRRHGRRRRGRRRADRRGPGHLATGIPVFKLTEEESSPSAAHGGRAAQARHRPEGRHQGALPGDPAYPCRPEGPEAPRWLVHLRRPVRCR